MRRLHKLVAITKRDHRLLVSAILLLGTVRLGLWLLPFQTLRRFLAGLTQRTLKLHKSDQVSVDKIIWAVRVASRYIPGRVKCLARALTTQVLLEQRGYQAQLRIGVAKGEQGLEAHAWVESQGRIVIGGLKDIGRYTTLPMEAS